MTEEKVEQTQEEMQPEEVERLHELITVVEVQLENIGAHHPKLFGPALLSLATFLVEKIYTCSATVDDANAVIASASEIGLQNWVDQEEFLRTKAAESVIQTLDG
jgi:hypothetical protein